MDETKEVHRGDIIYVDFGSREGSIQGSLRPAVVMSNDMNNHFCPTLNVVPLSTRFKGMHLPCHCVVESASRPSVAYCEQVTTVARTMIDDIIGRVTTDELKAICKGIIAQMELA